MRGYPQFSFWISITLVKICFSRTFSKPRKNTSELVGTVLNTVLNEDFGRVEKWLTANKLTLNASKTEFILIGSRQRLRTFHNPPSLMIDGAPISQVTSTKSLGVHIDQSLSWNAHVENLCKKIASGIGALNRVRSFVPHEILRSIFMSLIQCSLTLIAAILFGDVAAKP